MGSPLRLTIPGAGETRADVAWSVVTDTFDATDRALSRFDPASDLSGLNLRVGRSTAVAPLMARSLGAAWRAYRLSGGRFDPRIIGALERAGERAGVPIPPSPERLRADDRWLWLDVRRGLARISAPIDLGGIGKGLALRLAAHALRRAGFTDLLLSAGGDIVALGSGPAGHPWIVGLEDPSGGLAPLTTIELRDVALATSSTAVRSWTGPDGRPRHHLIDPATQRPADSPWASVTVAHADPAWAEVWAKVGFLAGTRAGAVLGDRPAWMVPAGPGPVGTFGPRTAGHTAIAAEPPRRHARIRITDLEAFSP